MSQGVLVFVEVRQGAIKKSSLEAVGAARAIADSLGEPVTTVTIGDHDAKVLARAGADQTVALTHDLLDFYSTEGYTDAISQVTDEVQPRAILGAATAMGRDLLPRVAARLRVALAQDCIGIEIATEGKLECTRPIFAGKAFEKVQLTRTPAMATLRPNVFSPCAEDTARTAEAIPFTPNIAEERIRARVTGTEASTGLKLELTEANIVVSGGRGLKAPENFAVVADLADALGGALGASRAAVDAGWIDHRHQVGQTGKTVSPTLYVACGISGAIQHLAGMSSSKYIVAINKDPEAPIFKLADFGIVGDLFTVVPALAQEVRKIKSE